MEPLKNLKISRAPYFLHLSHETVPLSKGQPHHNRRLCPGLFWKPFSLRKKRVVSILPSWRNGSKSLRSVCTCINTFSTVSSYLQLTFSKACTIEK